LKQVEKDYGIVAESETTVSSVQEHNDETIESKTRCTASEACNNAQATVKTHSYDLKYATLTGLETSTVRNIGENIQISEGSYL
jgi:hypothetical protein